MSNVRLLNTLKKKGKTSHRLQTTKYTFGEKSLIKGLSVASFMKLT